MNKIKGYYYLFLNKLYKTGRLVLQVLSKELSKECNDMSITYKDYVIKNIEYSTSDNLYHANCNRGNYFYSLQGATIDLLIVDLIESVREDMYDEEEDMLDIDSFDL